MRRRCSWAAWSGMERVRPAIDVRRCVALELLGRRWSAACARGISAMFMKIDAMGSVVGEWTGVLGALMAVW